MQKTDNSRLEPKLLLRRTFLRKYHGGSTPLVLDACQGGGTLWAILRREFTVRYAGADVQPRRPAIKVDSARLFDVPGWRYDVVDIDTYGEPWRHYERLCRSATAPVTVFLTVGLIHPSGFGGNVTDYVRRAMGVPYGTPSALVSNAMGEMLERLIWYPLGRLRLVDAAEAFPHHNARYVGLRLAPAGR